MKKKNLLALFLALTMATSTAAAFTACNDDDDTSSSSSSSSSSSTDVDAEPLTILNSDFESYDDHDGAYPMVTDVEGWTWSRNTASSGTAIESKSASGIVDTAESAWDQFTTSGLPAGKTISYLVEHVDEAEDLWDTLTAKDKVEFYEAWEDKNPKKDIDEELDFYEKLNIDADDLMVFKNNAGDVWEEIENPGTPNTPVEKDGKTNTKVLMLRNDHSSASGDFIGTAAKYTSTTNVTVDAGTIATFSVWVKTANMRDQRNELVVDKGAYIQITHALGSKAQEPLLVKNINTQGEWEQYSFTLKASPFTSSSFTIVLGLGLTGGTNRLEYVNGVAFFDDITCEVMQAADYTEPTDGTQTVTLGGQKEFPQNENAYSHYTIDFTDTLHAWDVLDEIDNANIAPTTETGTDQTYSSVVNGNPYPTLGGGFSQDGDIVGKFNNVTDALFSGAKANDFSKAVYNSTFAPTEKDDQENDIPRYLTTTDALVLFSAHGAAYTAKTNNFSLAANARVLYSFFVKTSEMNGLTGATVKLVDYEGNPAISLDSTTALKIEVGETEDIHDGWVQCFFFIHNDSGMAINDLHFEFSYGPTTIINTAKSAYQAGFAVFTNFQTKTMSDKEFECAVSGDHAKVVTLSGKINDFTGDSGFGTPTLSETMDIEKGYALPKEYTGKLVGDNAAPAGLLDKEYADNYSAILNRLGGTGAAWDDADLFGDPLYAATATRPLVIETSATASYGFIGSSASVSANSLKTVSLRVKVSEGAVANVYLIDTTDDAFGVLQVERGISYWYDAEGNVLSKDPADDDFYARKHTAFKKQSNGLYKVNPTWEYASSVDANKYYANLQAYERDAKNGNLLLSGDTTYAYNDAWKHDGNDGIAFYASNEDKTKAYAYSDNSVEVYDFSTVTDLLPRYTAKSSNGLSVTITDTDEKWVEVVFHLRAGATAKSYRLEVWNGARDSVVAENTSGFVAFDVWSIGNDETKVDTWLSEAKEGMTEGNDYFENVFSFYDNAQYLRYDASLDQNNVKDAFKSYTYATDGEGVAYLYKKTANRYTTYANFSFEEAIQTPDPVEDDSNDSSSDDSKEDVDGTSVWMLASSIAIAAVLLFAVISLIVRKIVANVRRKRGIVVQKPARVKKEKKSK